MEELKTKRFLGTPFAITSETIKNSPGTWASSKITIYRNGISIGKYVRNYSNFGISTFYPFMSNNEWYALYSANYTTTRVMKIYDDKIEDWCGEIENSKGFCPSEYYIPRWNKIQDSYSMNGEIKPFIYYEIDNFTDEKAFIESQKTNNVVDTQYCNFAFYCGCVWGDDTSWKLRYIDLSKIPDKELIITSPFGYWELPNNLPLKKCIDMDNWEPDHQWINLTKMEHFNLKTGEIAK